MKNNLSRQDNLNPGNDNLNTGQDNLNTGQDNLNKGAEKSNYSASFFRSILDSQNELIVRYREDGEIVYVNKAFSQFHKVKPEILVGKKLFDLFPSVFGVKLQNAVKSISPEEPVIMFAFPLHETGLLTKWINWVCSGIYDNKGKLQYFLGVGIDITQAKILESELTNAKKQIKKSEFIHRIVTEHSENMEQWVLDDGTFLFISPSCEDITGYSRDEFLLHADLMSEIIHPDDRAFYHSMRKKKLSKNSEHIQFRIFTKNGSLKWLQMSGQAVYDEQGNFWGNRTSSSDITEIKNYETALSDAYNNLKEINEKYKIVSEYSYDMERWVLPDGTLAYISPSCERLTGYTREEFLSQPDLFLQIFFSDDKPVVEQKLKEALAGIPTEHFQTRIITKTGQLKWIEISTKKVLNDQGEWLGYRTSSRDITKQKDYEHQLSESRALYSMVLEDQTDFILRHNADGVCTFSNIAFAGFFGLKPKDVQGSNWRDWSTKEEIERTEKFNALLSVDQPVQRTIFDYRLPNGSIKYIEWINQGIFDNTGQLKENQIIGRDVTEVVEADNKLKLSEARYKAVVENQRELIVKMSSDGTIQFVNDFGAWFEGTVPEYYIGLNAFDLDKEYISAFKSAISKLTRQNPVDHYETVIERFDGAQIWFAITITGIFNELNELKEFQIVGHDITELKATEQRLMDALSEVNELKIRLEQENLYLREKFNHDLSSSTVISDCPLMKDVLEKAALVSQTDSPVLLLGETGTGKEVLANYIHSMSKRSNLSMIIVNCGALPSSLIESELFGREKGAYTGALTRQIGRFELADKSTIFLDEIGELPTELQVKLLRIIQSGEFQMLGCAKTRKIDVRIIAATNRNLEEAIHAGHFRRDLFYRLSVFPIKIPPLRERREDIPLLTWKFVDEISVSTGKRVKKITPQSMKRVLEYSWPGNIRELKNAIEYSIILLNGQVLDIQIPGFHPNEIITFKLDEEQKKHILTVLEKSGWRIRGKEGAAELLGLKESTLRFRMKKLGIQHNKSSD